MLCTGSDEICEMNNAALKVLFFEKCKDLKLIDSVPPWYSPVKPKAVYESSSTFVKANRVDAGFVDHKAKHLWAVQMSCPWTDNRKLKRSQKRRQLSMARFDGS